MQRIEWGFFFKKMEKTESLSSGERKRDEDLVWKVRERESR